MLNLKVEKLGKIKKIVEDSRKLSQLATWDREKIREKQRFSREKRKSTPNWSAFSLLVLPGRLWQILSYLNRRKKKRADLVT
jgi:hypothetical protein